MFENTSKIVEGSLRMSVLSAFTSIETVKGLDSETLSGISGYYMRLKTFSCLISVMSSKAK